MSWLEIETKIAIPLERVKYIRTRIRSIAKYVRKEKKRDDYYSLEYFHYPEKSLRLRDRQRVLEVNFKKRHSYIAGIHAKKEVQFAISDKGGFVALIKDFGFRKWLHKEKTTELYQTKNGVHIELNNVTGLGWFIEIEVLCSSTQEATARKKVRAVRAALGFGEKDSQQQGYTKQLWEKQNNLLPNP